MMILALACLLAAAPVWAQKSKNQHLRYRWTDSAGVLHLADEIPPSAVDGGYDLVNQFGRVVRHVDGKKTPEQIAAEKARKEAAKEKAAQARRDHLLLVSYATEDELVSAQKEHLSILTQRIKATEINMKSQLDGLANMLDRAAAYKQRGDKVPAYVESQIDKQRGVIRKQRGWIASNKKKLAKAKTDAAAELARYRKLRGTPRNAGSVTAPAKASSAPATAAN